MAPHRRSHRARIVTRADRVTRHRGRLPVGVAVRMRALAGNAGGVSESLKSRLLVATPGLADPNFSRTVVLMIEHNEDGALGVVLNRPGGLDVEEPLPEWAALASPPAAVFVGGPVAAGTVIAIALGDEGAAEPDGWVGLFGGLGAVDVGREPGEVVPRVQSVRVFSGYAGWAPGQLDGEVAAGGWFVVDSVPSDVFTPSPEELWAEVLRRQPGRLRMFAGCPADPTTN